MEAPLEPLNLANDGLDTAVEGMVVAKAIFTAQETTTATFNQRESTTAIPHHRATAQMQSSAMQNFNVDAVAASRPISSVAATTSRCQGAVTTPLEGKNICIVPVVIDDTNAVAASLHFQLIHTSKIKQPLCTTSLQLFLIVMKLLQFQEVLLLENLPMVLRLVSWRRYIL
ncbi:hypothetical protein ACH5RR_013578 [Cinchona calisaya]|uniref:Uncharacterized protein n=1 Tax=Cinchona calisaya TaxID=153742 RepID=A0ABD3A2M7_9GENT